MELLTTNNVWMMLCAALVFFMHLGFSFLEIGLTRQKNTINILFKNFFIITMGLIAYCLIGFNLMYPGDFNIIGNGILGFAGPVDIAIGYGDDQGDAWYANGGSGIVNMSFSGSKELQISDSFSLPVFGSFILNPEAEAAFLVFGISF